ncbi:MAG: hypothetical protein JSV49_04390 [Thermoplasmata archaeon]|nr:MAG: hypothetical protein JSV49_04390 [Thermoplasmata archaeon]
MTFKTLRIKKEVYEKLLSIKQEDESFSDLFERLSKNNIVKLRKLRGSVEFKNKEAMLKEINSKRRDNRVG